MNKNKYKLLKSVESPTTIDTNPPLFLKFRLKNNRFQNIDLTFFVQGDFPRIKMANVFAWYFWHLLTWASTATRSGKLNILHKFNVFLNWKAQQNKSATDTKDITFALLSEYQIWLVTIGGLSKRSAHGNYIGLVSIINSLLLNKPEYFRSDLKIPLSQYSSARYEPRTTPLIGIKELSLIAEVAISEADKIIKNHGRAKKLLQEGEERTPYTKVGNCKPKYWKSLSNVLVHLVKQVGINNSPKSTTFTSISKNRHPSVSETLNTYVPISDKNFIPFLILLFFRTAINVETLFSLKRNCLRDHALPLNLKVLEFEKTRAGSNRNLSLSFPAHQKNGVVELINFLIEYTAPWVEFAIKEEKDFLFLYKSVGNGKNEIRSPGENFSYRALRLFIKEHNLPYFNFAQIRPTVATQIYLQTRDIFRVQRLLGHSSVTMTINYISQEVTKNKHNLEIRDGISSFIDSILEVPVTVGRPEIFTSDMKSSLIKKVNDGEISENQAKAITIGNCSTGIARCKDPLNSPLSGEKQGRVCQQLHMCIFCENAWIFEEDLPKVIHYRDQLEADRKNLTESVWNLIHGEAFREITEVILTSYLDETIEKATILAKQIFVPYPSI